MVLCNTPIAYVSESAALPVEEEITQFEATGWSLDPRRQPITPRQAWGLVALWIGLE